MLNTTLTAFHPLYASALVAFDNSPFIVPVAVAVCFGVLVGSVLFSKTVEVETESIVEVPTAIHLYNSRVYLHEADESSTETSLDNSIEQEQCAGETSTMSNSEDASESQSCSQSYSHSYSQQNSFEQMEDDASMSTSYNTQSYYDSSHVVEPFSE